MFLGLTIQKAYLNDVQRSVLYNAICKEIETGCDEIQIICHTTILDFAALYLQEISLLVKERLLLDASELHVNYATCIYLYRYNYKHDITLWQCFR